MIPLEDLMPECETCPYLVEKPSSNFQYTNYYCKKVYCWLRCLDF